MRSRILLSLTATLVLGCGGSQDDPDDTTNTPDGGNSGRADAAQPSTSDSGIVVPPSGDMSFFVTSVGNGANGGNYGGLDGADARCQMLAEAVGAGARTWRAYLSTGDLGIGPVVDARDRIGAGPWYNAKGELVAADIDSLHQTGIAPELMLDENSQPVPRIEHDLLTGSDSQGRVILGDVFGNPMITTCKNWTSAERADFGWVGHTDNLEQWNNSHFTRCNEQGMRDVSGSGRLMCFAID